MATKTRPLYGWRLWRVSRNGNVPVLTSLATRDRWPADRALAAGHSDFRFPWRAPHESPAPLGHPCQDCGIHAYTDLSDLARVYGEVVLCSSEASRREIVGGVVAVWGRLVLHEYGLRAQFARPLCLLSNLHGAVREDHYTSGRRIWIPGESDPWHQTVADVAERYGLLVLDHELSEMYGYTWGDPIPRS